MPSSSVEGRRIAGRYEALAVVWVSESDDGFALWVFDGRSERVLARPLPSGPPFDEPMAAQVALIVKTFLRSIPALAPERHGSHAPLTPVSPPIAPAPEPGSEIDDVREPSGERPLGWDMLLAAGVRGYATTPSSPDGRLLLGATVWPRGLRRMFGLSLLVESGPGLRSTSAELDARWTDSSLMVGVRGRLRLGAGFDIGGTFGVGMRLTTLFGETGTDVDVARLRVAPHARVELEVGVVLASWLRLELRGGTTLSGYVQRYFVGEVLALEVKRATLHALLGLEFRIR